MSFLDFPPLTKVHIRPKKLENRLQTDNKTGWQEDIQIVTKTKKKFKKSTVSLFNAGPSDRASVLSTKCGGCHPKGLIVASSYKVKQIIILIIVLALLDKNENKLKLLFSPLVSPNFWN